MDGCGWMDVVFRCGLWMDVVFCFMDLSIWGAMHDLFESSKTLPVQINSDLEAAFEHYKSTGWEIWMS